LIYHVLCEVGLLGVQRKEQLMAEIGEPEKRRVLIPLETPTEPPSFEPSPPPAQPVKQPDREPV
jgi:hypothetical protein